MRYAHKHAQKHGWFEAALSHLRTLIGHSCLLCENHSSSYLCTRCIDAFTLNSRACFQCGIPIPADSDHLCGQCLAHPPNFDRVITPFIYDNQIASAIRLFKEHGDIACGKALTAKLGESVRMNMTHIDALVPVPMHWRAKFLRRFNQADEMAYRLSKDFEIPVINALKKSRPTDQQKMLKKKDRVRNLKQALASTKTGIEGKRIALIDDVVTTGATADICAKLLKKRGVEYVEVWALARTPLS